MKKKDSGFSAGCIQLFVILTPLFLRKPSRDRIKNLKILSNGFQLNIFAFQMQMFGD